MIFKNLNYVETIAKLMGLLCAKAKTKGRYLSSFVTIEIEDIHRDSVY